MEVSQWFNRQREEEDYLTFNYKVWLHVFSTTAESDDSVQCELGVHCTESHINVSCGLSGSA